MTSASQANYSGNARADATFVSQSDATASSNVASGAGAVDEIQDFCLPAGDKIDLTDVVAHFAITPDQAREALYFKELSRGTELGIEVDGAPHKITVVHGVTAAALRSVAPWIFDPAEVAQLDLARDANAAGGVAQSGPVPDEFIFGAALRIPSKSPAPMMAKTADVSQLAMALGLSEVQVLDALNDQSFAKEVGALAAAEGVSAALSDADALVL